MRILGPNLSDRVLKAQNLIKAPQDLARTQREVLDLRAELAKAQAVVQRQIGELVFSRRKVAELKAPLLQERACYKPIY